LKTTTTQKSITNFGEAEPCQIYQFSQFLLNLYQKSSHP